MHPSFKSKPVAGAAALLVATGILVACGGGGGGSSATDTGTTIPISGAGNSPFIGVKMKVECANGAVGEAEIGTATAPGEGSIKTNMACTGAVKLTVSPGALGKMRPIGASEDGSQDITYDPTVNIPIASVFSAPPEAGQAFTANPVTTLVAEKLVPTGGTAKLADITTGSLAATQTQVETALGLPAGSAAKDYRDGSVAAASARISEVAAIAAPEASAIGTEKVGLAVAQALVLKIDTANALQNVTKIADSIKTVVDITAKPAITTNAIEADAVKVNNLINQAAQNANFAGASVAAMLKQVSDDPKLVDQRKERALEIAKIDVQVQAAKMVQDVMAVNKATTQTDDQKARVAAAQEAAKKIVADSVAKIESYSTKTAEEIKTALKDDKAQFTAVTTNVKTAITNDASAPDANKVFKAPPTVGSNTAAVALVSSLQTAGTNASATNALNVAKVVGGLTFTAPPAIGATAADKAAFNAALASVVAKVDTTKTLTEAEKANLATTVNNLQTVVKTAIANNTNVVNLDQKQIEVIAKAGAASALGSGTVSFATPPTVGTTVTVTYSAPTVVTPPAALEATVMSVAQKAAVDSAQAKLTTAIGTAKTQAESAAKAAADTAAAVAEAVAKAAVTTAKTAAAAALAAYDSATAAQKSFLDNLVASSTDKNTLSNEFDGKVKAVKLDSDKAAAAATAAQSSYDALIAKLFAAAKAKADTAVTAAQSAATTAKEQAAAAKSAEQSAAAATTLTAAQAAATAAQTAATAAQTAADTAKSQAAVAASAGLPAGSDQEKAANASATEAQTAATAAKASVTAAQARVTALSTTTTTSSSTTTKPTTTTTAPAPTTTNTVATTTVTTVATTTTTTLPKCDPFAPPPAAGSAITCTP